LLDRTGNEDAHQIGLHSAPDVREWDGPAVLQPCQRTKLARGTEDKGARHVRETRQQNRRDIGIDIGKNSFHIVGQDRRGALVLRQKWSRGQVEAPACRRI
jgi:hypothetical protein